MTLDFLDLALLALAGFAAGWINVLAGGGSMFNVAALVFLGLPGPVANGANRVAILAQSLAAVAEFRRKGFSDFKLSASLAATASIGAYFGAKIGVRLDGEWFERTVALAMVAVALSMALDRGAADDAARKSAPARNLALGHALMVGAGFWGGFIQIGVGFLLMPILYRVMGLDLVRVNMHKVFVTLVFTVVALAVFAAETPIAWQAGIALALANAVGGWAGARATMLKGAAFIKGAMYAAIAALAVKLLFF
ncbi:MAG: sulfite exporter TauE/SafE family protein [Parvularculaceae bacterium]